MKRKFVAIGCSLLACLTLMVSMAYAYGSYITVSGIGMQMAVSRGGVTDTVYRGYEESDGEYKWNATDSQGIPVPEKVVPGEEFTLDIHIEATGSVDMYSRLQAFVSNMDRETGFYLAQYPPLGISYVSEDGQTLEDRDGRATDRSIFYCNSILSSGYPTSEWDMALIFKVPDIVSYCNAMLCSHYSNVYVFDMHSIGYTVRLGGDAVQQSNAMDAIYSAWGRKVNIQDGVLSLIYD